MIAALLSVSRWLIFMALVAIAAHIAIVLRTPTFLMARTIERVVADAGWHTFTPTEIPSAQNRLLIPPNPDFLTSACAYDLSQNHVALEANLPKTGLWSVALYNENAELFYTYTNTQADAAPLRAMLVGPASRPINSEQRTIIVAPSFSGLIVVRGMPEPGVEISAPAENYATCKILPR